MTPCTHPGTSREVNEARQPHTFSKPRAVEEKKHEITGNSVIIVTNTKKETKKEVIQHIFLVCSTLVAVCYQYFHLFPW